MKGWPPDKRVVIHPGEHHVVKTEMMISTLLGSCVAACLYDPVMRVIGMNHFLLANKRYARENPQVLQSEAGRYGMHAMELLINNMLKAGAQRRNLRAKVFGGGNVLPGVSGGGDSFFAVGNVNSRFILEYLQQENIPVVAKGLGGSHGRIIHFVSTDFSVFVKRIAKSRTLEVEKKEKQYWNKSIQEHEKEEEQPAVQFW
jgi:chemotaxis protein CheD